MSDQEFIAELCAKLGIVWSPDTTNPQNREIPWDGTTLHGMTPSGKHAKTEDVIHEIGHWVVALPEFRKYVGFGLGPAPDVFSSEDDDGGIRDGRDFTSSLEELASAIGVMIHRELSADDAFKHARGHSWDDQAAFYLDLEDDEEVTQDLMFKFLVRFLNERELAKEPIAALKAAGLAMEGL